MLAKPASYFSVYIVCHNKNMIIAALISLQTLQNALATFGYPAVIVFVMIECIGIPFPGETMLLLASFYAAVDTRLQIPLVIVCAALGAILGDNIGYLIGRTGGRAFLLRFGRFFFVKPQHLAYAEQFFIRHGNKTVFFGRFTTLLRLWSALLAGVNSMPWRIFLLYNAAGGIVWAIFYGALGYGAGRLFHDNFAQVERLASTIGWIASGAVVVTILLVVIVVRTRLTKHRRVEEQEEAMKVGDRS